MWSLKENALEIRGILDSGETPGDLDFGDLIITNGSVFYDMQAKLICMMKATKHGLSKVNEYLQGISQSL